ncbi:hypothetical protein [Rhizobium glycinendophyticum]|uniref:Uncharacterized protein n=1 Tax=Rhizobium glycinendophyticum TaxID=2589807 RepID=A0A504TXY3_9HYPH|nr:hypothetical protein [Rhizobium glycinendophyticum]TPP07029.1 hypothetical protein FJQ55_15315 [Rhizobium glycinendophyticum]
MTDHNKPVTVRVGAVKQRAVMIELDGYQIEYPHTPFEVWAVMLTRGDDEGLIESLHATEARAIDHAKGLEAEAKRLGETIQ